jgi:hypothetical protein
MGKICTPKSFLPCTLHIVKDLFKIWFMRWGWEGEGRGGGGRNMINALKK